PSIRSRGKQRAEGEREKQAFGVADVQKIGAGKNQEKENAAQRNWRRKIQRDKTSQDNGGEDQSDSGDDEPGDEIIARDECDHACCPREQRVKPGFYRVVSAVSELRDVLVVKRIPVIPELEPRMNAR